MFLSRFPYWVVSVFAIFSALIGYGSPTNIFKTFPTLSPEASPNCFGAVSTVSFQIGLRNGLPKVDESSVNVPYRRKITVKFDRDDLTGNHFIVLVSLKYV